ncbi:MAG: hypothetical protein HYT77_00105 [Deltaproteobacteria bacterium]|nr:hypothetical protein [Deltaproteobacteria bacterium]
MKAVLVYWHKARLQGRYVLEMEIHKVGLSKKYPHGIKYGLVLADLKSGKKILMDNHHPKGPHVHLDSQEIAYEFSGEEKLIKDFKTLIFENMGVKI